VNVDARWAEAQVLEHTQKRRQLGYERHVPAPRTRWDRDEDAPPPALAHAVDPDASPDSSPAARVDAGAYSSAPDRWAARFTDGKPPPPPPPPPISGRDMIVAMQSLGIDPADPKASLRLETMIEDGALAPYGDDLYVFIRAQQRASQKRREKRAQLVPQHILDNATATGQFRPYPNDRSGGGPMQPGYDPSNHVLARPTTDRRPTPEGQPTPYGSRAGTSYPGAEQRQFAPPPLSGVALPAPVYDPSAPMPEASYRTAQVSPLTQSQKRRLRRKKSRLGVGESALPPSAPAPSTANLQWENQMPGTFVPVNGAVSPTNPNDPAYTNPALDRCNVEVMIAIEDPRGGDPIPLWFTCPLKPYPHPQQPHIVQLPFNNTGGTEVFVGWFDAVSDEGLI
jgi:hypothetical protein